MPQQPLRLLLVEDNPDDALLLVRLLRQAGYNLVHERLETEAELRQALERATWDVILADYSLPAFSAVTALSVVQDLEIDVPFIVVTGTISEAEAVTLMHAGAHDYVIKGVWHRLVPAVVRETREARNRAHDRESATNLRLALASLQAMSDARAADLDAALALIVRALDLRDQETAGHSQRVTQMTVRLARVMALDNGALERIGRGALLHDIGKMHVPDSILLKPGPLTEDEWTIMRQHPIYAYELLYPLMSLRSSLDIPHYHHERWDGGGYPRGLAGEAIPIAARIFAVVDSYDALISTRPYRAAWSHTRAMKEIKAQVGSAFDPKVVSVFCREMRRGTLK